MNRKRKMLLQSHLWLIAIIIVVAGLVAFSLRSAQAKEKQAEEPNKAAMMEEKHEEKMHGCMNMCVKNCQTTMEDISSANAAIKVAMDAIEKGCTSSA